jgi:hypothetical protein
MLKTGSVDYQLVDIAEKILETYIQQYPAPSLHKCSLVEGGAKTKL